MPVAREELDVSWAPTAAATDTSVAVASLLPFVPTWQAAAERIELNAPGRLPVSGIAAALRALQAAQPEVKLEIAPCRRATMHAGR